MQSLYKNENLLFKDFQDFLVRNQHLPEKRIPFYLRWVIRFHEFCSRQHLDGMEMEAIAPFLQDLAKDHEDWQVQQAKEAVRLYRYFRGLPEPNRGEQPQSNGQTLWQPLGDEIVRALRLRHRYYRTEQSYRHWLERFGPFLGFKEPRSVNQQDLDTSSVIWQ
jgi:Phage integrase, N-terminal SAM-like domain